MQHNRFTVNIGQILNRLPYNAPLLRVHDENLRQLRLVLNGGLRQFVAELFALQLAFIVHAQIYAHPVKPCLYLRFLHILQFIRVFKRFAGISPGVYKETLLKKESDADPR